MKDYTFHENAEVISRQIGYDNNKGNETQICINTNKNRIKETTRRLLLGNVGRDGSERENSATWVTCITSVSLSISRPSPFIFSEGQP